MARRKSSSRAVGFDPPRIADRRVSTVPRRVTQIYHSRTAMAGMGILIFFTFLALAAPWLAPYGPRQAVSDSNPTSFLQRPNPLHPLGTNYFSFDIYSQIIWGPRLPHRGNRVRGRGQRRRTAVGLISGFAGGWLDEVMMRFNDVVLSIPWLVLMIIVAAKLGVIDLTGLILVIGLTGWSVTARVIRSQVLSIKERVFIERARMIGSRVGGSCFGTSSRTLSRSSSRTQS